MKKRLDYENRNENSPAPLRSRAASSIIGAATQPMKDEMDIKDELAVLAEYIAAQDEILRELMGLMIGLGEASKAWGVEETDAGLSLLARKLTLASERSRPDSARFIALLAFAKYAQEWRARSQSQIQRSRRSDEGLQ